MADALQTVHPMATDEQETEDEGVGVGWEADRRHYLSVCIAVDVVYYGLGAAVGGHKSEAVFTL